MAGVLERIVAKKREEIAALHGKPRPAGRPTLDVRDALVRTGALNLITEIKKKSPSAGPLSTKLSVAARARIYAAGGASMISVLCDSEFFDGSFADLAAAREAVPSTPLLAKEFVLDVVQIDHALAAGADAVLLIARILDPRTLGDLVDRARRRGIEPLVEVVDEKELHAALDANAVLIGVNARDLDTLQMDAARTARVLAAIPPRCVRVHLSGLKKPDDVAAVAKALPTVDAALMGEALMREDDPAELLAKMRSAAGGRVD